MLNIYYINLNRSPERNKNMIEQLKYIDGIKYKRIEAIDGQDNNAIKNIIRVPKRNYTTKSELGAFASHLKAIRTAYNNNLQEVFILEDDLNLSILQDTIDKLKELWDVVKYSTEILQVHANGENTHDTLYKNVQRNVFQVFNKSRELRDIMKCDEWGMTAYLINRRGMENIMQYYFKRQRLFIFHKYTKYPYIADVLIYILCQTKIVDIPFVNIENPEKYPSTIRYNNYMQPITYLFIEKNKDIIIQSINNRKLIPRSIHLFHDMNKQCTSSIWNVHIWTYDKMKTFIQHEYPDYLSFYLRIEKTHKLIFFSYICLYHHGGVFMVGFSNMKQSQQLSTYLMNDIKLFFESNIDSEHSICNKYHYVSNKQKIRNDIMMCVKNNIFMKNLILYCIDNYDEHCEIFEYFISLLYYAS